MIVKRAVIPVPRRKRHPADLAGDAPKPPGTYDPSGKGPAPAGFTHLVDDDPAWQIDGPLRLAALPDLLAYYFNWEGLLPFFYHDRDFATPEEGDPKGGLKRNQVAPRYCTLALQQFLADPTPVELEVDHRYGKAAYYETECGFALHEDGAVQLWDGWGGVVEMGSHGGRWTTAGDIDLRAGRNINLWAGHDLVLRARDSVDVTSSKHDIRLVAWRNLMGLAGTGGCGGVALESQAVKPSYDLAAFGEEAVLSGVNLIAPHSAVYALTPDLVAESPTTDGRAVIDMGPRGLVRVFAKLHEAVVGDGGARYDLFLNGAACDAANEFRRTSTLLGTPLYVHGTILADGDVAAGGAVRAKASAGSVGGRAAAIVAGLCPAVLTARVGPPHAEEVEVTLRTDSNYRTEVSYVIDEARWQVLARLGGQSADLPAWTEPPVAGRVTGIEQYPFPGGAWIDPTAFRQYVPTLVDPATGWTAVTRTELNYSDPTPDDPTLTTPDGVYRVVANHTP